MTVIQLANHDLVVISPIQVNNAMVSQLNEIGTVRHIIAPNLYHYLFAANFKMLYPNATFWAVPGLETKKTDLAIDQIIPSDANHLWDGLESIFFNGFRTLGLRGIDSLNECVFFHGASRSLILTDTVVYFDESFPVITQLAARVLGGYNRLAPALLERIATTEKEKVRGCVEKVLKWDFDRVIMAHGTIVEQDGKTQFKQGYDRFLGRSL